MLNKQTSENPTRIVRAACPHDCPDTYAMLVTVERENGTERVVRVLSQPRL